MTGGRLADPAAVDAWRLLVSRLSDSDGTDFTPSSVSPEHLGRVAAWLASIAAGEMAGRQHDGGLPWGEAFAAALRDARGCLSAAEGAAHTGVLARLAVPPARTGAPRTVRRQRGRRKG